jgi:uncharacterized protein (TIGR00369 family)
MYTHLLYLQGINAMVTSRAYSYGIAAPQDVAGKTGKELLEAISDGRLPAPPIAQVLTFWIVEVGDGFAAFEGETGPHLLNPFGTVHGGWALTLIDSAAACAAHSLLPAGVGSTTVETKANFSRPITTKTGRVRAEAHVIGRGRKIISTEARLLDAERRVLAHGTSTIMVLDNDAKGEQRSSAVG